MTSVPSINLLVVIRWIAVAISVASIVILFRSLPTEKMLADLSVWIDSLGFWGPVVLTLIYLVATILLIPGAMLTLLAGAAFGLVVGTICASIGATLGASICFLIARYAARDRIEAWAQKHRRFGAIDRAIGEGGWKFVALMRLSPVIPFNLQNYLYGLTSIRFWPYFITSWIAMLPVTFLYVYLGHIARAALNSNSDRTPAEWALLGMGLLATVVVTIYITRLAKSKIDEHVEQDRESGASSITSAQEKTDHSAPKRRIALTTLLIAVAIVLVVLAVNSHVIVDYLT